MRKLEDPIHIMCFNWLETNVDGLVYHTPNEFFAGNEVVFIKGRPIRRAILAWKKAEKMGAKSGVLDITLHWSPSQTAYFEIKSDDGSLTKNQKDFMASLDRCKIPHRVIRSLNECQQAVADLHIPLRRFS